MSVSQAIRNLVAERARHCCEYCQSQEGILGMPFEVEHILPSAAGGLTEETNLCLSCSRCNRFKGMQTRGFDAETETTVTLFNPRQANWYEHFAWTSDGLRIVGLTPTGRATIETLRLNNDFVLHARQLWVSFGLHPITATH